MPIGSEAERRRSPDPSRAEPCRAEPFQCAPSFRAQKNEVRCYTNAKFLRIHGCFSVLRDNFSQTRKRHEIAHWHAHSPFLQCFSSALRFLIFSSCYGSFAPFPQYQHRQLLHGIPARKVILKTSGTYDRVWHQQQEVKIKSAIPRLDNSSPTCN
jgi:hypothetical protein